MSKITSLHAAITASVTEYKKAAATLKAALEAQRHANTKAAEAQHALGVTRIDVARAMKKAGLNQARCQGLLLSIDATEDELIACADAFVSVE